MDYKEIGERIRNLRKLRRITQKELGRAIMRSESSIAKYEQGLVEIPPSVLMNIAEYFDIDAIDLLGVANVATKTPPSFAIFRWVESLGYRINLYEEEEYRILKLENLETYESYTISDEMLRDLTNNIASFSRFQISELIKFLTLPKDK